MRKTLNNARGGQRNSHRFLIKSFSARSFVTYIYIYVYNRIRIIREYNIQKPRPDAPIVIFSRLFSDCYSPLGHIYIYICIWLSDPETSGSRKRGMARTLEVRFVFRHARCSRVAVMLGRSYIFIPFFFLFFFSTRIYNMYTVTYNSYPFFFFFYRFTNKKREKKNHRNNREQ